MNTGPVAERGFDLALTEVVEDDRHYFTVQIGSDRGAALLDDVPHQAAAGHERVAARAVHARTCFCTTVEDVTDLAGKHVERRQSWDSCFTVDYSHIHGGAVRASPRSRYRQWMTHKLASWWDQFDSSGCVGCGRCITWCPVGIDITEEARAIRETEEEIDANA